MLEILTRYWWAVVVRGIVAILFGLVAIAWPGITLIALVILFGVYAFVDGVFALGAAISGDRGVGWGTFGPSLIDGRSRVHRGWLALEGGVGILAGIVAFAWPGVTTLALLWVIVVWALITGVLKIVTAVRLRRDMTGESLLLVSGALSVLLGILLAVWPASGALALVILIGIYALVFGIAQITLGVRLRRLHHEAQAARVRRPAPA
jgi:uncharacterized membrane protein HdeD (DUF308 family)